MEISSELSFTQNLMDGAVTINTANRKSLTLYLYGTQVKFKKN